MIRFVHLGLFLFGVLSTSSSCLGLVDGFTISTRRVVSQLPKNYHHHDSQHHHYYRNNQQSLSLIIQGMKSQDDDQEDHEKVIMQQNCNNNNNPSNNVDDDCNLYFGGSLLFSINRRSVVQSLLTSTTTLLYSNGSFASGRALDSSTLPSTMNTSKSSLPSTTISGEKEDLQKSSSSSSSTASIPNLQCLMDLPPSSFGEKYDVVRIYLCRHGQTENNRLHLVQGARVDPSLNDTGKRMAYRLGRALSNLPPYETRTLQLGVHSYLKRAKETAQLAFQSLSFGKSSKETDFEFIEAAMTGGSSSSSSSSSPLLKLESLPELGEVDFGPGNEGKPAAEVRGDMYTTFGAWAIGKIDTRPRSGEGESGRDVLNRASQALTNLALLASKNGGSIMAVSHSFYIRMLLSMIMEIPLAQAVTLEQKNGCVNVLDIPIRKKDGKIQTKTLGPKSNIFGPAPFAPSNFHLTIPNVKVIRLNENRHLTDLM